MVPTSVSAPNPFLWRFPFFFLHVPFKSQRKCPWQSVFPLTGMSGFVLSPLSWQRFNIVPVASFPGAQLPMIFFCPRLTRKLPSGPLAPPLTWEIASSLAMLATWHVQRSASWAETACRARPGSGGRGNQSYSCPLFTGLHAKPLH